MDDMASNAEATRHRHRVVVLIGPESTGKSTLAERLANRFSAPLSLEFAREYVSQRTAPLDHADIDAIARGQMALEDGVHRRVAEHTAALVIKDTDLVSTLVYARHYYGHSPRWLEHAASERRGGLYLLCAPDVPWVADGPQRDRPHARVELHARFAETLAGLQVAVVTIAGAWAAREEAAVTAVEQWLTRSAVAPGSALPPTTGNRRSDR